MRISISILSFAVLATIATSADDSTAFRAQQTALAQKEESLRRDHKGEIAFLLGMSRSGKDALVWEGFYPSESSQRGLYARRARALAVSVGYAKPQEGTKDDEAEWQYRILRLLEPFYTPAAYHGSGGYTEILEEPAYWDDASRKAYLVGVYCRYGHGDRIGYLPTAKAWFVAHLLRGFYAGRLEVSTLVGPVAPGGSKIDLPNDPKIQTIVAEAKRLLAEERPNKAPEPTPRAVTPRATEGVSK